MMMILEVVLVVPDVVLPPVGAVGVHASASDASPSMVH